MDFIHSKAPRRPAPFRGREELGTLRYSLSLCIAYIFNILIQPLVCTWASLRHPRGKPFDADPVRLCQTTARKGAVEIRFEAVLADLRPMFLHDRNLCDSSAHVSWPGGPGRSLILKQICSGLLKACPFQWAGSLPLMPKAL